MVKLRKLYRSRRDKKLSGLCGGLGEMLNVDATLLRILLIIITILSSGTVILIYLVAALVVPKEPPIYNGYGPGGHGALGSGYGHYTGQGPSPGPGPGPHYGNGGGYHYNAQPGGWKQGMGNAYEEPAPNSQFDSMMDDLEKKALRREIEELKSKLAQYEKGES
ncbi:PspC domain-containing protein [Paenibacillus sp. J5C_2022]|uniref:PspC domain-containing protein n=1 Tax=Paenibacillus sp. J5C2022 TaxID=2977129 RepID=UPI0021CF5441|nr:PspC domain-containing protein [Paenibacillus sp. J5C2022]MCU6712002.1 PspC domain-containing protein [Paenibacillus sp. J5C2022]